MSTTTLTTADQLLRMPDNGCRYELLAGELKMMSPAGWKHGVIAGRLHGWLFQHVEQHSLGTIFTAETGFLLGRDPDTVRTPDVAFVRNEHFPEEEPAEAYWPGAPDLAVEVVSPRDTVQDVDDKVKAWLTAGAMMVWVVNPNLRNVTVYRSATDIKTVTERDDLDGEDIVTGFRCPVAAVFARQKQRF